MRSVGRRSRLVGLLGVTLLATVVSLMFAGVSPSTGAPSAFKVAFLPVGPINDRAWSQSGYEGLVRAQKELGVKISFSDQAVPPAEAERVARGYVQQGNRLILFHGGQFIDAATSISKQFPRVWFCVGGLEASGPNLCSYDPKAQEGTFLAGALSALMSKSGKLGLIGGFAFPQLTRQLEGFKLGARYVKPAVTFQEVYINSWTDVAKAKSAATSLIDGGADVIFTATDEAAQGAYSAAQERHVFAIASYSDQNQLAPQAILASVVYDLSTLVFEVVQRGKEGTLQGRAYVGGLSKGVGNLSYNGTLVPAAVKAKVEAIKREIINGKLRIPTTQQLAKPGSSDKISPASLMVK